VTIDEKRAEAGAAPPKAIEVEEALRRIDGASAVRELPTDETAHKFEIAGAQSSDLRAEIFRLVVAKSWTLLELRRDAQSLDAVFRDLTRGSERADRGLSADKEEDEHDDVEREDEEDEDEPDEGSDRDEEPSDDDDDDDDDDGEEDDEEEDDEPRAKGKG
jgi:ABC-2 type transport system ATP-binding protein